MPRNSAMESVQNRPFEDRKPRLELQVFSTCPAFAPGESNYISKLIEVAQWSERAGCVGSLIYTDNSLPDPWAIAQLVIQNTTSLCPLVAVQPVYMHPYTAAKKVSSLSLLHGRRVFLNMVAGGFKNDLIALNDPTPHDLRYARLIEYTQIIQALLAGNGPVTFEGEFYKVKNLSLSPKLEAGMAGDVLMSGSSEAGLDAARRTGAIAVQYPEPPEKRQTAPADLRSGVRVGIVARSRTAEAWEVATTRFPEDRKGQITRSLATKVSDSNWHKRLEEVGNSLDSNNPYWLRPFEHYHTNCPYLVGSYGDVAAEVAKYVALGYRTFILDIPASEEEFFHIHQVFTAVQATESTSATGAHFTA